MIERNMIILFMFLEKVQNINQRKTTCICLLLSGYLCEEMEKKEQIPTQKNGIDFVKSFF